MSIRSTKYLGEDVSRGYIKASTEALLAQLKLHHDYDVPFHVQPKRRVVRIVEEQEKPVPVEVRNVKLTMLAIQQVVCRHFGISLAEMYSARRDHQVMKPRQIAMYLANEYAPTGMTAMGRSFRRDRSTLLSGIRKITRLVAGGHSISDDLTYLRGVLSA